MKQYGFKKETASGNKIVKLRNEEEQDHFICTK